MAFGYTENTLKSIIGEEYEGSILSALIFKGGSRVERRWYQSFDLLAKQYLEYKRNKEKKEIQETKAGLEAIQNMYEPEGEPSYAYFNNEKIEIKGGFSMPMQTLTAPSAYDVVVFQGDKVKLPKDDSFNALSYSLQAFSPATTEGTKKPVIDPLKEINNIIVDTFKNPLIQAKKDAEKYEHKFNKVVEQARYWKGQYKLMSGYHDDELANVESYQKWYKELEFKFKQCQEKSESFQAANKILGETVERAAKLNSDMKIKVDRLEERLATELAKNFDMNFKSAIDRIKQQKDELKKRGKEIVELKESLEKLAIEEEKLEKQLDEEVNKGFELEGKYNDLKKKFDSETIALYELVGELVNEKEKLEKEIEERSKTVAYWKNQADLWKQNSNEYQRFWEGQKAMVKKAIEELKAKDLLIETYEARKSADLETMQKLGKRIEELEIENEKLANPHDCEENQVIEWEDGQPINVKCGECKAILWRKE